MVAAVAASGIAARLATQLIALAVTLVAARYLGPSDFGVFAIASIAITYIRTILYCGSYEFLMKAAEPRLFSTECFLGGVLVAAILSCFAIIAGVSSSTLFGTSAVGDLILQLTPSNFIAAYAAWLEVHLLRHQKIGRYYSVMFISEMSAGIVAIGLLLMGLKLEALVAQVYLRAFVNCAGYWWTRTSFWSTTTSLHRMREALVWAAPRYGEASLGFLSLYCADLLLGAFMSTGAAGLYRAANRICSAVADMVSQPLRIFGLTRFSRIAATGGDIGSLIPQMVGLVGTISGLTLGVFAGGAHEIVTHILGDTWNGSIPIVPILCIALALSAFNLVLVAALVASNLQKKTLQVRMMTTIVQIVLVTCLAPFGPFYVAIATATTAAITATANMSIAIRRFPGIKKPVIWRTIQSAGGAVAIGFAVNFLVG